MKRNEKISKRRKKRVCLPEQMNSIEVAEREKECAAFMKKFIRYLYEYQNGRRVQNTGFVKVNESEDSAEILIYGKRFPAAKSRALEIFVFYMMGNQPVGISMGTVTGNHPMFGYRLEFAAEDVGGMDIFRQIEGIILVSCQPHDLAGSAGNECSWYGAVWNEGPVNIEKMMRREEILRQIPEISKGPEEPEMPEQMEMETPEVPEYTETESPEVSEHTETEAEAVLKEVWQGAETAPGTEVSRDGAEISEAETVQEQEVSAHRDIIYKITRQDMAKLPRREWKLANNQFLLHGYRNYHHLVSFEKDEKCWLGVPGVYHPREEQAAAAFGFNQFMKPEEEEIELMEDEKNEQDDFGYWCRAVSSVIAD